MAQRQAVAVLTPQFVRLKGNKAQAQKDYEKSVDRFRCTSTILSELEISAIVSPVDRLSYRSAEFMEEARSVLRESRIEVDAFEVQTNHTAECWLPGIVRAIRKHRATVVLNFAGDIVAGEAELDARRLRQMCDRATTGNLVIGDYACDQSFKHDFDDPFVYELVEALWGAAARDSIKELGISKLRSEFFAIGAEFFQDFERQRLWSSDPTIQLILYGLCCRRDVTRHDLGRINDDASGRSPKGQFRQVWRIWAALVTDAMYAARNDPSQRTADALGEALDRQSRAWEVLQKKLHDVCNSLQDD